MCKKSPKLAINTVESHSDVFIVNFEHISHFLSVSMVVFEKVNVCRGALSCVNKSTKV